MPALDREILREWPATVPSPVRAELLRGGMVARTFLVHVAGGWRVVAKMSSSPAADEADGLRALAAAGVPVPEVLSADGRLLVLEHLTGPTDWAEVGRAVAAMHQVSGPAYGWHQDNHCGRFDQPNGWRAEWPAFFAEQRVRVHLDDPQLDPVLRRRLERACDGPIQELLPTRPVPVLTHGDLWSGNVVAGRLVDPEVSYADRELDLACLEMDRRLPPELWAAYVEVLPPSPGYPARRTALQLHHLLLHVRHFGPSRCAALGAALDACGWA